MQSIRTASVIAAHIKIQPAQQLPLYQKLAKKATELRLLVMSYPEIAKALNIGKNTAIKVCELNMKLPRPYWSTMEGNSGFLNRGDME